jgi:SAM-dependent methyltransferase
MIVQNEEECLARALDSIHEYVDEIVVVDGGSTDSTREIARSYEKVRLYNIPFPDNYGVQRSRAIELAHGTWIFIIDADEEIDQSTGENFTMLISHEEYDAYRFSRQTFIDGNLVNLFDADRTIRLFRSYCRYEGIYSESVVGFRSLQDVNLMIKHSKTAEWQQKDNEKYWDIGVVPPPGWVKIDDEWQQVGQDYADKSPIEESRRIHDKHVPTELPVLDKDMLTFGITEQFAAQAIGTGGSLLDIGCGNGRFIASRLLSGDNDMAVGLDISDSMIEICRETLENAGVEAKLVRSDMESYIPENRFDAIIALESLEHWNYIDEQIKRVASWLNPKGVFAGTLPYKDICGSPIHINRYDEDGLRGLLTPLFKHIEICKLDVNGDGELHLGFICYNCDGVL